MAEVRFLHTADIHLHAVHRYLDTNIREREHDFLQMLVRMKDYIEAEGIPIWLIAGDVWEHERVTPPTISFLQKLFADIPQTRVFISPGNHDPITPNSYYRTSHWPENVTIFGPQWEHVGLPEWNVCVYGIGFRDIHEYDNRLAQFPGKQSGYKRHIVVYHGHVVDSGGASLEADPYSPVHIDELKRLQMDYIALGHIHQPRIFYDEGERIVAAYAGSPESLRASETGVRQAWLGAWHGERLVLQAVPTNSRLYRALEVDLTGAADYDYIVQIVEQSLSPLDHKELLRVRLVGEISRHLTVTPHLFEAIARPFFYVQWIDATVPDYDIAHIQTENSILAHFLAKIESKKALEADVDKKEDLEAAKRIILSAFLHREVKW